MARRTSARDVTRFINRPARRLGCRISTRLRREHHRMLGNGYCTRPAQLDGAFESICETCSHFQTSSRCADIQDLVG